MGGAIVDGWRVGGHRSCRGSTVIRPSGKPVEGVRTVPTVADAGPPPRLVVLAFKPQKLDEIAPRAAPWLTCQDGRRLDARRRRSREPARALSRASRRSFARCRTCRSRSAAGVVGAVQRGRRRRDASSSSATSSRRSASRCGWPTRRSSPRSARSPAPALLMSRGSSRRWPRPGEKRGLSTEIAATIALETVLGTAWMAATTGEDMDVDRHARREPQGHDRSGPRGARPRRGARPAGRADDRGGRAPRRRARRGSQRPVRLPRTRACPRRLA